MNTAPDRIDGMSLDLIVKRDADLTQAERETVAAWQKEAFGHQTWTAGYTWTPPEWRLLLAEAGEPVSHLKVVTRLGSVGGTPVRLGGIGSVMTPGALRGRGYASELMRRAAEFMFGTLRVELGMLFCLPPLTSLYRGMGWIEVKSAVWIEHPTGRIRWPHCAMVLPRPGAEWVDAEIDVRGLPW